MTHLDITSPSTYSSEAPIGNRLNCSDIWFHLNSSNSVSPGLTNGGLPTTRLGERHGRPVACQPLENYRARWPSAARRIRPQGAPEGALLGGRSARHP